MKEITIIAKNEVGALAAITEALGGTGVNIEAVSAYEKNNGAVIRLVTNDPVTAMKTLAKIPEIHAKESNVIILKLMNRPGELGKVTRKLAIKKINVESMYIVTKSHDYTEVAIKPAEEDFLRAQELLTAKLIH